MKTKYDVCIVGGLGHVGLPLGISLADVGNKVVLYDINEKAIETVSSGRMPFLETGAEEKLEKVLNQTLFVSGERAVISKALFVIIVIGTPVDEHLNPKFVMFRQFFETILDYIQDGQHILLRSTLYPGTTEKIKHHLETQNKKVNISFCPERIAQGKSIEELQTLPQIVSAFDGKSLEQAKKLFSTLTEDIICLHPIEAELAKLFTNVWRYIQFSISNQFYQIAIQNNIDFYKIFSALKYKYPRAEALSTPGFAAGPCLFKDTMQLAAFSNNNFFLGHAAMLINEGLPNFIVQRLKEKYDLKTKTVGILGMAFKANNDDRRESLSYKLKKILEIEAKETICSDVYIQEARFVDSQELIRQADIIIIGSPHQEYAKLELSEEKILIDIWNLCDKGGYF